ncbi:TetR/AcrR family transcriptional regulator [Oleomonas cavernae]|nr:TetR/AcrR family transcriptional regulator [Oleomonas cavernae]
MDSDTPGRDAVRSTKLLRRRQEERSASMRMQLVEATIAALIERGYARTTSVEICQRAGVTRGALLHHFDSLADLFAVTLSHIYDRLLARSSMRGPERSGGRDLVESLWDHFSQPEYKAVIELWLAARNEPELGVSLSPAILQISNLADPRFNPRLSAALGQSADAVPLYRLILESMIGMALGRAVTPGGGMLGHEERVVDLLGRLAGEMLNKP